MIPGPPGYNGFGVSLFASQYSRLVVIITASRFPLGQRKGWRAGNGTNLYFIGRLPLRDAEQEIITQASGRVSNPPLRTFVGATHLGRPRSSAPMLEQGEAMPRP